MIRRKKGGDYVNVHSQLDLPRVSEKRRSWHGEPRGTTTMTELVTALLAFFSASVSAQTEQQRYLVRCHSDRHGLESHIGDFLTEARLVELGLKVKRKQ
jgi:hypothetical protein